MKTLLLLGASSDIGLALLRRIGSQYDRIIAHYNATDTELRKLQDEWGEKLILKQADFSSGEDTKRLMDEIVASGLHPTHIVHLSALPCKLARFNKTEWLDWQSGIDVSLRSVYMAAQAFFPNMAKEKQGKLVVMLTAYTENKPPKFLSNYVTVKYALLGFVKALAREYADKGIMVNGVSPEMTDTRFLDSIPRLTVAEAAESNPLGRNLSVDEVVGTFAFLLSQDGDRMSGQNICITAGQ